MENNFFLQNIENKIIALDDFHKTLLRLRFSNKKIVFTNGCFDILHAGHVHYLAQARSQGDYLIVGLNNDASVKRLKGLHRPINDEHMRSIVLAALAFVDAVTLFEEDTPINLIEKIVPNVLIKGGDYKIEEIVGADFVLKNGGEVKILSFLEGYSTTKIEQKIKK